jgi:arabinose-5-phosphate isomerase
MLKTLFLKQQRQLSEFFEGLDFIQLQKVYDVLLKAKGTLFFSGVGKSGHIAEKLAATFASTGTRAFFLSPVNALHGDIGVVTKADVCLLFSRSGETAELLELASHLKRRGAFLIAIVSTKNSSLSKIADLTVFLPVKQELCPYDLAPTTSTTAQLIFGDCLAVALMQAKEFSLSDFADNHPLGALGRKITKKVADVMLKFHELPLCSPDDLLLNVLHELSEKKCGCLLAIYDGALMGIFTDGDLRRAIERNGAGALQMRVSDFMTKEPKSISSDVLAIKAVQIMESDRPVTVLPVIDKGSLVGLVRMHDILKGKTDASHILPRLFSHHL